MSEYARVARTSRNIQLKAWFIQRSKHEWDIFTGNVVLTKGGRRRRGMIFVEDSIIRPMQIIRQPA